MLNLAAIKLGRFWSPWPNANRFASPALALASAAIALLVLALVVVGAWSRRRDPRAAVLLAGPLVYFCVLHIVFASSMRYRVPAEMPALGLVAIALNRSAARFAPLVER